MNQIKVVRKENFNNHEIPIVEECFGERQRLILVKTICEIYNFKVSEINKILNTNISDFNMNDDLFDIKRELLDSEELRKNLGITLKEVGGNTKNVYALSDKGHIKLLQKIKDKDGQVNEVRIKFIEDYFFKKNRLEELVSKCLDENGIRRIFKAAENNAYIKEINRVLTPPRGKKGIKFKSSEIEKFKAKVNKDMERFLLVNLKLDSLTQIPEVALSVCMDLIEKCYTLPEDLRLEFYDLSRKLTDLRFEVIEENRIKNNLNFQFLKNTVKRFTELISGV